MARLKDMTFANLNTEYETLLSTVRVDPLAKGRVDRRAHDIIAHKAEYKKVADAIGCPWELVGVIHYRERDLDFNRHLHNGDPLTHRTVQVPRGRPTTGAPPFSWSFSAEDALRLKNWDDNNDWSEAKQCFLLEQYNGFGYRINKVRPLSPYLWSGTSHYSVGKYTSDGSYDPFVKDKQLGCIALLEAVRRLDIPMKQVIQKSQKGRFLKRVRLSLTGAATSLTALYMTSQQMFNSVMDKLDDNRVVVLAVALAAAWFAFRFIENMMEKDYKEGRWTPSGMKE